jgi:hypothetical protein
MAFLTKRLSPASSFMRNRSEVGWRAGENFQEAIRDDETVKSRLSSQELDHAFDVEYQLKNLRHTVEKLGI